MAFGLLFFFVSGKIGETTRSIIQIMIMMNIWDICSQNAAKMRKDYTHNDLNMNLKGVILMCIPDVHHDHNLDYGMLHAAH